mmetsp:Transcript_72647/g.113672  ORF Transcript_72647/g.113672 Transcript_72647/m.113672 type:complete len:122 (+) Transcript_72647:1196-1561(+)
MAMMIGITTRRRFGNLTAFSSTMSMTSSGELRIPSPQCPLHAQRWRFVWVLAESKATFGEVRNAVQLYCSVSGSHEHCICNIRIVKLLLNKWHWYNAKRVSIHFLTCRTRLTPAALPQEIG